MAFPPLGIAMPPSGQLDHRSPAQKSQRLRDLRLAIAHASGGDLINCIRELIPTIDLQFQFLDAFDARDGYKRLLLSSTCNIINNPPLIRELYSRVPHAQEAFPSTASRLRKAIYDVEDARYDQLARFVTNNHDPIVRIFLQQFFKGQIRGVATTCWGCLRAIRKSYSEGLTKLCASCVPQWLVWQKMGEVERDHLCIGVISAWDRVLYPRITTPFDRTRHLVPELYHLEQLNDYFAIPIHGQTLSTIQSGAISQIVLRRNLLRYIIHQALVAIPKRLASRVYQDERAKSWLENYGSHDMHDSDNTSMELFQAQAVKAVREKLRTSGIMHLLSEEGSSALLGVKWSDLQKHISNFEGLLRRDGRGALCVLASLHGQQARSLTTTDERILAALAGAQQDPAQVADLHRHTSAPLRLVSVIEAEVLWKQYRTSPQYEWLLFIDIACIRMFPAEEDSFPPTTGGGYQFHNNDLIDPQMLEDIAKNGNIPDLLDKLKVIKYLAATRLLKNFFKSVKFFDYMRTPNADYEFWVRDAALIAWNSTSFGRAFNDNAGRFRLPGFLPFPALGKIFETPSGDAALYAKR